MNVRELRQQSQKLVDEMRSLSESISAENRDFTAAEKQRWDRLNADVDKVLKQIRWAERAGMGTPPATMHVERDRAIRGWMAQGTQRGVTAAQREAATLLGINLEDEELVLPFGKRLARSIGDAPQTVTTTGGGYLVGSAIASAIETAMLLTNELDGYAQQIVTDKGGDFYMPLMDDTANEGELVDINSPVSEAAVAFGRLTLKAYKGSSKNIIVPYEMIEDSAYNVEEFAGRTLGERLGRLRARQSTTGAGTTAPTGVLTAATAGVTAASPTTVTADEVVDLEHSVPACYRNPLYKPAYMMNGTTLKAVRKLKDGNGQYLWQPGLANGPQTVNGYPVIVNPAMPDMTTGAKAIAFGAWQKFVVRTIGEVRLIRNPYTYATKDQTLFVAFLRFDCNVLDAGTHPLKYLTMHA